MDYPALITAISDARRQALAGAAGAVDRLRERPRTSPLMTAEELLASSTSNATSPDFLYPLVSIPSLP